MPPPPGSADYQVWLNYSEGSAMPPLMLNPYVSGLKEAGSPLHPRIDSEIKNHLGYTESGLQGREFFVGNALTGADIQMSFVVELARVFDRLASYPNLGAWLLRKHAAPGVQALGREGRGVPVCPITVAVLRRNLLSSFQR